MCAAKRTTLVIICLIFSIAGNISIGKTEEAPEWIRLLDENRGYLAERLNDKPGLLPDGQKQFLNMLKQPIALDSPDSDREFYIGELFQSGFYYDAIYLEDNVVVRILVSALNDPCKKIRDKAFRRLLEFTRDSLLISYSEAIRDSLARYEFSEEYGMLGLILSDENEKKSLLSRKNVPERVRARLGDKDSEDRLISEFRSSDNFDRVRELAEDLAYIRTASCRKALAEYLASDMITEGVSSKVSIKYIIIQALGKIHPNNQLLTLEVKKIKFWGDDDYGGSEAIRNYLRKVCQWAEDTYGIRLPDPASDSVLYKHIVIGTPVPDE